jgi:hypothetical protein
MSTARSRQEDALRIGKLRLMLLERLCGDLGLLASTLLVLLGLRAEAFALGTASLLLTARSRRP